jgi:hypothetical protein
LAQGFAETFFAGYLELLGRQAVVRSDAPEVAFEVRQVKALPAVLHIADVEDHLGSGGFGGGLDLVGVDDDEVDAFGLAQADFVGLEPYSMDTEFKRHPNSNRPLNRAIPAKSHYVLDSAQGGRKDLWPRFLRHPCRRGLKQVLFRNFALSYNELAIGFSRKFPIISKRRALILRFLAPQRAYGHTRD